MYVCRSITLDNQLVVLATTAADAGRYHVEAVNDMTGENATSPAVYLSISGEEALLPVFFLGSLACRLLNESAQGMSQSRRREKEMQVDQWQDDTSRLQEC